MPSSKTASTTTVPMYRIAERYRSSNLLQHEIAFWRYGCVGGGTREKKWVVFKDFLTYLTSPTTRLDRPTILLLTEWLTQSNELFNAKTGTLQADDVSTLQTVLATMFQQGSNDDLSKQVLLLSLHKQLQALPHLTNPADLTAFEQTVQSWYKAQCQDALGNWLALLLLPNSSHNDLLAYFLSMLQKKDSGIDAQWIEPIEEFQEQENFQEQLTFLADKGLGFDAILSAALDTRHQEFLEYCIKCHFKDIIASNMPGKGQPFLLVMLEMSERMRWGEYNFLENFLKEIEEFKEHQETWLYSKFGGISALHAVCKHNYVQGLKTLLEFSDAFKAQLSQEDDKGSTPVHDAVRYGALECLEFLIIENEAYHDALCAKNEKDNNILHLCIEHQQLDILKLLFQKSIHEKYPDMLEEKNHEGFTPLSFLFEKMRVQSNIPSDISAQWVELVLQTYPLPTVEEPGIWLQAYCDKDKTPLLVSALVVPELEPVQAHFKKHWGAKSILKFINSCIENQDLDITTRFALYTQLSPYVTLDPSSLIDSIEQNPQYRALYSERVDTDIAIGLMSDHTLTYEEAQECLADFKEALPCSYAKTRLALAMKLFTALQHTQDDKADDDWSNFWQGDRISWWTEYHCDQRLPLIQDTENLNFIKAGFNVMQFDDPQQREACCSQFLGEIAKTTAHELRGYVRQGDTHNFKRLLDKLPNTSLLYYQDPQDEQSAMSLAIAPSTHRTLFLDILLNHAQQKSDSYLKKRLCIEAGFTPWTRYWKRLAQQFQALCRATGLTHALELLCKLLSKITQLFCRPASPNTAPKAPNV